MIADNFTVFSNNQITTIGIITANPLFCRCHAKGCIQEKYFHLVFIELMYLATLKVERILIRNLLHRIFNIRCCAWHTIRN